MKRKLINRLADWKENCHNKSILLTGGRGVGKTFLALDFAKTYFDEYIYINFEREPYWYDLLIANENEDKIKLLQERFRFVVTDKPILLVLDEISLCPDNMKIIRFIINIQKVFHILAISSKAIANNFFSDYSYKDYIQLYQLYPLDFEEYLIATGNSWYIEVIQAHYDTNKALPDIVHKELLSFLEEYLQIGGMPSVVNEFINTDSKYNISEKHRILVDSYLSDIRFQNMDSEALKINQILNSMDKQLMKENHKFQYTLIRKGATQTMYAESLQYINDTYYGITCTKFDDNDFVKKSEKAWSLQSPDETKAGFKLYFSDVGILYSALKTGHYEISNAMKKGLLENYIAQSLTANDNNCYFWESTSQAKIEFVIKKDDEIIPIEVRANENTRSKNYSIFKTKYEKVNESIKISTKNFGYSNHVKYVPVYAAFCI